MRLSLLHFGVLSVSVSLVMSALAANGAPVPDKNGRTSSWTKSTQGSPDLKAARAKVDKNPKDPVALNDLGWACRQNGKLDEAARYLKLAIEIKPEMGEAHSNLSVVYYDQSKFSEALSEAQKAVKIDADHAVYRVVLGNALSRTGKLKEAQQEYKVAIHLKPDYEKAHYNLGRVLNEDGQVNEAKYSLSKALQLDPKDDLALSLLDKLEKVGDATAGGSTPGASKPKGKK